MEIVEVKIEEHLEKKLMTLLDRRMEDIINEVVKRAIPELTYAMIQNGYQNDQPTGIDGEFSSFGGHMFVQGPPGILPWTLTPPRQLKYFRTKRRARNARFGWTPRATRRPRKTRCSR